MSHAPPESLTIDSPTQIAPGPIVFFDGDCGFCDRVVRWIIRHDREGRFWFAPLGGETYGALIGDAVAPDVDSMVLLDGASVSIRSDAALRVMRGLRGIWGVAGWAGSLFPRVLREGVYRLIAANRRRLAKPPDTCRVPSSVDRQRFLP